MRLELLVLFFTCLKSSNDVYNNLLDSVKQKIMDKDYFLVDSEKVHYLKTYYVYEKKIIFKENEINRRGGGGLFIIKGGDAEYNTADEAIQEICDNYLLNISDEPQGLIVFHRLCIFTSKEDVKLNLRNFFYNEVESSFVVKHYDDDKQRQIKELCLCFSRDKMININLCLSSEGQNISGTIRCFEEKDKMKIFFPFKLRNLMFFLKIDVSNLSTIKERYTNELVKIHKDVGKSGNSTDVCAAITKIFTFSDFLLHPKLLNDVNSAKKKKSRQVLFKNFEKNFFRVVYLKEAIYFNTLNMRFFYFNKNPSEPEENCQYISISEKIYNDCIEIWNLYTKAKHIDIAKYKIIFHKLKDEILLISFLYKICDNPNSASHIILMHLLGHYNILDVEEIISLTKDTNSIDILPIKVKLSKIHFMMTPMCEEVNNLLYILIYYKAEKYFKNYKKKKLVHIELLNNIQEFSNLYLGHNNMTLKGFYRNLVKNRQSIISSGEETLLQLFQSISLLTNLNVKCSIGGKDVSFDKENARIMFQELGIDDPDNLENYVEELGSFF